MKRKWLVVIGIVVVLLFSGCAQETQEAMEDTIVIREETIEVSSNFPKIASWVAKKDEIHVDIDNKFDLFVSEMILMHWKKYQQKFKKS